MNNEFSSGAEQGESVRPTYGELRRQLAENGNPWTVDPLISDDEPLPDFPLGGLPERDEEERVAVSKLDSDVDISELIAKLPPNDPGLRQRWAEVGVNLHHVPTAVTGDRVEDIEPSPRAVDDEPTPEGDDPGNAL